MRLNWSRRRRNCILRGNECCVPRPQCSGLRLDLSFVRLPLRLLCDSDASLGRVLLSLVGLLQCLLSSIFGPPPCLCCSLRCPGCILVRRLFLGTLNVSHVSQIRTSQMASIAVPTGSMAAQTTPSIMSSISSDSSDEDEWRLCPACLPCAYGGGTSRSLKDGPLWFQNGVGRGQSADGA